MSREMREMLPRTSLRMISFRYYILIWQLFFQDDTLYENYMTFLATLTTAEHFGRVRSSGEKTKDSEVKIRIQFIYRQELIDNCKNLVIYLTTFVLRKRYN